MKKYNRAQEKRNDLISVINYTISKEDDKAAPKLARKRSKGKLEGHKTSGGTSDHDRKYDGKRRYKSGRSSQKNRSPKVQREQNHETEISSEFGFSHQNSGKHRSRCRTEDQESQRIADGNLP